MLSLQGETTHTIINFPLTIMKKLNDGRGYDLDYYNLYLRRYLREHRFPEADDDLFIANRAEAASNVYVESRLNGDEVYVSSQLAIDRLTEGLEISPYDFVSEMLVNEFADHISLDERSIEFWTYTLLDELEPEFKDVELSEEFFSTNEGVIFKLVITGRITEYFEEYGL